MQGVISWVKWCGSRRLSYHLLHLMGISCMNIFSSFWIFISNQKSPEPNINTISLLFKHITFIFLFRFLRILPKNAQSSANNTSLGTHKTITTMVQNYILIYSFFTIAFAILLHSFCELNSAQFVRCCNKYMDFVYLSFRFHSFYAKKFATRRINFFLRYKNYDDNRKDSSLSDSMDERKKRNVKTKSIPKMNCSFFFL